MFYSALCQLISEKRQYSRYRTQLLACVLDSESFIRVLVSQL